MALNVFEGNMGGGKTYTALHRIMSDYLLNTERPVYTNIPINVPQYLTTLTRKESQRAKIEARLHFLKAEVAPVLDAEGQPVKDDKGRPFEACKLREFWHHCEPNAVVVLDELGELYNSRDRHSNPELLGYYINQHRHYKDDVYFICQSKLDIDAQVRRKIQYLWRVKNSLKENISEAWWMRGLRWPVQFFIVEKWVCQVGEDLKTSGKEAEEVFWVRPNKYGYRSYNSFSASTKLTGKKLAKDEDASSDVNESFARRLRTFWRNAWRPVIVVFLGAVAAWFFWKGLQKMDAVARGEEVGFWGSTGEKKKKTAPAVAAPAPNPDHQNAHERVQNSSISTEPIKDSAKDLELNLEPPPERLLLVVPGRFVTDQGEYLPGDQFRERTIAGIDRGHVTFLDGERQAFRVLFRGNRSTGLRSGQEHQRTLPGVSAYNFRSDIPAGNRHAQSADSRGSSNSAQLPPSAPVQQK